MYTTQCKIEFTYASHCVSKNADKEISEKRNFFVNRSVRENFSGQVPMESLRTQDSENVYERWVQQIFDPVLPARNWEMPIERVLTAKIGR